MRRRPVLLAAGVVLVASASVAYAASTGLTAKRLTVLSADAPTTTSSSTSTSTSSTSSSTTSTTVAPNAMTITLANGTGATARKADKGDSLTLTFDPSVKSETFCSSWTGNAGSFNLGVGNNEVSVTIVDGLNGAHDTLSVSGVCAGPFNLGTISLGSAAYVSQNVEFKGPQSDRSTVVWTPGTKTMVITLGSPIGSASARDTVTTPITTTFTPDSDLRDTNNKPVTGTATTGTTF